MGSSESAHSRVVNTSPLVVWNVQEVRETKFTSISPFAVRIKLTSKAFFNSRALGREVFRPDFQARAVAKPMDTDVSDLVDRGVPAAEEFLALLDEHCPRLAPNPPDDIWRRRILRFTVNF